MVAGRRKPPAKRAAAPTTAAAPPPAPTGLPALRRLLRKAAGLTLVDTTEAGEYVSPVGAKARAGLLSCAKDVQTAFSQAHQDLSEHIDARRVLVQLCAVCLRWATEGVVCLWANRSYEASDADAWAWDDCAACSETLARLCYRALTHRLVRELRQMLVCRCAPNLYPKVRYTASLCAPYAAAGLPAHAQLEGELARILLPSGGLPQAPEADPSAPPPAKRAKTSPQSVDAAAPGAASTAARSGAEAAAERLRKLSASVLHDIGQKCHIPKRPRKEETVLALVDEWRRVLPFLEAVEKGLPLPEAPSPAPSPAKAVSSNDAAESSCSDDDEGAPPPAKGAKPPTKDAGDDGAAAERESSCSDDDEAVTAPPTAKRAKQSKAAVAPRNEAEAAAERLRKLTASVLHDIRRKCHIPKRPRKEETVLALADEWRRVLPFLEAVEKGLPLPEAPLSPTKDARNDGAAAGRESSCSDDDEAVTAPSPAKRAKLSQSNASAPRSEEETGERLRNLTLSVLRDIGRKCHIPKRPRKEETVLALADEWRRVLPFLEAVEKGLPLPETPSPAPSPAKAASSNDAAESSCSDDDEGAPPPAKRAKPSQRSKGAASPSAASVTPRSEAETAKRLRLLTLPVLRDIGRKCHIPYRPRKEETVLALADEWQRVLPFLEAVEKGLPLPEAPSPAPSPAAAAAASAVEEADKGAVAMAAAEAAAATTDVVSPEAETTRAREAAAAGAGETRAESSRLPSPPPSLSPPRQAAAQGAATWGSQWLSAADAGFSAWLSRGADGSPAADSDDSPDHADGSHLPPLAEEERVWEQAAPATAAAADAVLSDLPNTVAGTATLTQLLQPRAGGSVVSGESADDSLWSAPLPGVQESGAVAAPEAPVVVAPAAVPLAAGKEAGLQGGSSGATEQKGEIDEYLALSANVFASW